MNLTNHSPFRPWEREHGRNFYGGGDAGQVGAAAIYAGSNIFSWSQSILMPGLQAAASLLLMDRQKEQYDKIVDRQVYLIGLAIDNYVDGIDALLPSYEDAFPDVPEAAEYVPIDACCIQRATIECNIATSERANVYGEAINAYHQQADMVRAIVFDPRFRLNMDMTSLTIQDLLRGKLPVSDVMEVLTDNAEAAALNGRIGNVRHSTARDMGVSRLRSQQMGRDEFHKHLSSINRDVSPTSRQVDLREMMQTPAQRIALALQQAQLIQNSLQNKNNMLAQKAPYLMAQLQTKLSELTLKLQHEASKGNLVNSYVPNYAAALQPLISQIGQGVAPASQTHFYGDPTDQSGYQTTAPLSVSGKGVSERPYNDK